MRKVTLRGLLAHKLRLALTALAIVLGVTFISGTFVLTDTLNSTFSTLFTSVYRKIDFQVRGVAQFGSGESATRNPLPESLLGRGCRACPGSPGRSGRSRATPSSSRRTASRSRRAWAPSASASTPTSRSPACTSSRAARRPTSDDVVMDAATAKSYGFSVGQRVRVLAAG